MKSITKHRKVLPRVQVIAPNHTKISTIYGTYITSYNSTVAFVPNDEPILYLGEDWDYSRTTLKYLGQALNTNTAELRKRLKDGTAKLIEM